MNRLSARPSPTKKRSQRVKFRRRYANSLLARVTKVASKIVLTTALVVCVVGGFKKAKGSWSQIKFLQIKQISYQGDIPVGLQDLLGLNSGQSVFSFSSPELIKTAQTQFPELEKLEIHRTLTRNILIKGRYRTVLAFIKDGNQESGIDEKGTIFPMKDVLRPSLPVPQISGNFDSALLPSISHALLLFQKQRPDFFALIKEVKTDKIFPVKIFLQQGIQIEWPDFETENLLDRADIVLRFLHRYAPSQDPATLRFVTSDRLIIDSNWAPIQIQK